jgi:uncharacterized delta-60 repeat protein
MKLRTVFVCLFRVSRLDPPRVVVLLLMLGVALFCTSNSALAQAGKLDTTFATGGIFTDSVGQFPGEPSFANAVAIQGDGKIVVGGSIGFSAAVLRLNGNGTLDSTFGTGGVVTINLNFPNSPADQVIGVAVQPNGKIVAALSNVLEDANLVFLAARLNRDGSRVVTDYYREQAWLLKNSHSENSQKLLRVRKLYKRFSQSPRHFLSPDF